MIFSSKIIMTSLITAFLLPLSACTQIDKNEGARPGVRINDARAPDARVNLNTVVILDKSLQDRKSGKIAIESSGARRTDTNTLEVYAVIRNRTDFSQQLEARIQFFDQDGVPTEGPSAWQKIYLDPQSVGAYREKSTGVQGVDQYYVEIREAR